MSVAIDSNVHKVQYKDVQSSNYRSFDESITSSSVRTLEDLRTQIIKKTLQQKGISGIGNVVYSSKQIKLEKADKIDKSYSILAKEFKKKYDKSKYLRKLDWKMFNFINSAIINTSMNINFKDADVEITPNNSIFFNLLISDNEKITIEFFLDDITSSSKNTFFAIKENKTILDSGLGEMKDVFNYIRTAI